MPRDATEHATEVTESLDEAWKYISEALELTRYAMQLIRNDTEREKWAEVVRTMQALIAAIVQFVDKWDASPVGDHIRRERGSMRNVVQWLSEVGGRPK